MIRVVLPQHLRGLAGVGREVTVEVKGEITQRTVLVLVPRVLARRVGVG
jgi:molybdopterin synthase sulfur carrier subunit